MKYPEEDLAKALFADLQQQFSATSPPTDVSIRGAGVHWDCTVTRADSACTVGCLQYRGGTGYQGDEYCTSFKRDTQRLAMGRTADKDETMQAVADWLDGASLSQMYERYEFVDRRKRQLTTLRNNVGQHFE